MDTGFAIDPYQGLAPADEDRVVRAAAEMGYRSAWTPSGADPSAFERCLRWHRASGLPVGILVVPAPAWPVPRLAEQAERLWNQTEGSFTLGVGSGGMTSAPAGMRAYLLDLRERLPAALPLYLGALGPRMLATAAEVADGVALNWCSAEQVTWSRGVVAEAAATAGREAPRVVEYIRAIADEDEALAQQTLARALVAYALGPPQYRRHFERMGLGEELHAVEAGADPSPALLSAAGAWGRPGAVRPRFEALARDLDLGIVRVLVTSGGDADSALRTLRECLPN